MVATNGTSNSMVREFVLTPLTSAVKIADRHRHLVGESCELRRSEIMLLAQLVARGFISLRQRMQSGSGEVFGIASTRDITSSH